MSLNIDDTGVAVKLQSQTLKVARYCVRREVGPRDMGEVVRVETRPHRFGENGDLAFVGFGLEKWRCRPERGVGGACEVSTRSPDPVADGNRASEASSPSLSVQVPPSPSQSARVRPVGSPSNKIWTQRREPEGTYGDYDHLTCDELH